MDADVISVEASRSKRELLTAFTDYAYPNDIGLGVYDIHYSCIKANSGSIPIVASSPRASEEVTLLLQAMVDAARILRQ